MRSGCRGCCESGIELRVLWIAAWVIERRPFEVLGKYCLWGGAILVS